MKNYAILDIENPNARGNSICAIGLIIVQDGKISERKYSLINPEDRFDRMNSEITGLTESMVLDAPTLPECWKEIEAVLCENTIVGHSIRYDLSVLSKALERYDLAVPEFHYICTLKLSQSLINSDSYKLGKLVNDIGYTYHENTAVVYILKACGGSENTVFENLITQTNGFKKMFIFEIFHGFSLHY